MTNNILPTIIVQGNSRYYSVRPEFFDDEGNDIIEIIDDPNDPLYGDLESVEPYNISTTTYSWNCHFHPSDNYNIKDILPNYDKLNPWFLTPHQWNNRYHHIKLGYWEDGTVNFEKLKLLSDVEWYSLPLLNQHIKFHIEEWYSLDDGNKFRNTADAMNNSILDQPILFHRKTYRVIPNVEKSALVGKLIHYERIETTLRNSLEVLR